MAIIVLPHTLIDTNWFDANPVMQNFNTIKNTLNGGLDEDNVDDTSDLTLNNLNLVSSLDVSQITLSGNITIQLNADSGFAIMDGANNNFSVYSPNEVDFAGRFDTLPVGTIIQFDDDFTNNVTLPGWYVCDGTNGTVNLVDKFIMGSMTAGTTGGTNDAPVIQHGHTGVMGTESQNHTHAISGTSTSSTDPHQHALTYGAWDVYGSSRQNAGWGYNGRGSGNWTPYTSTTAPSHSHTFSATSGNVSVAHTHSVTITNAGLASGSNMPAYYTMLFIQRIS
jgi:hypothetical protein